MGLPHACDSEGVRACAKSSCDGWCTVQMTVRPVLATLRSVRMTTAAARASSPADG